MTGITHDFPHVFVAIGTGIDHAFGAVKEHAPDVETALAP